MREYLPVMWAGLFVAMLIELSLGLVSLTACVLAIGLAAVIHVVVLVAAR